LVNTNPDERRALVQEAIAELVAARNAVGTGG